MLNIRVPAGIGDISWCYSKLVNLNQKINLWISADNPRRSLDFVKLLPNINKAQYDTKNFHDIVNHSTPHTTTKEDLTQLSQQQILNFSLNRFLEQGNRIENFIPDLPTNLHYSINTTHDDKQYAEKILKLSENPIGIYTSNYINITNWNGWHLDEWKILITKIHKTFPKATFILLGATYDKSFTDDLSKIISPIPHINLTGTTTIAQTIEVIKILKYFISYPCGLPILANIVGTPVMMFYPNHLEKLINSWPDQKTINNNTYKGCKFPTPEQALAWLFNTYHLQDKL